MATFILSEVHQGCSRPPTFNPLCQLSDSSLMVSLTCPNEHRLPFSLLTQPLSLTPLPLSLFPLYLSIRQGHLPAGMCFAVSIEITVRSIMWTLHSLQSDSVIKCITVEIKQIFFCLFLCIYAVLNPVFSVWAVLFSELTQALAGHFNLIARCVHSCSPSIIIAAG